MAATAAVYAVRKANAVDRGTCLRGGCNEPPVDGSAFCEPHRDDDRKYQREYRQRVRRRRRRMKQCQDCGLPLRKNERVWCKAHRVARNRVRALQQQAGGVQTVVEKSDRIAQATREHDDGRTRYHGQQKRGNQPHAKLNAQDLGWVKQRIAAFEAGVAVLGSDEAKSWSRGERERVVRATANQGERAGRHIDDILERLGHFKQRHGRRDGDT